ncbi:hypothetical protein [Lactiplantibacillus carotarum]|uniref:hypothetical protein n=1 Tax=Lactiplantibacillus carotarum TaxID=2993456 RepID=UPI00298EEC92|nr:hypothetical protein [Lactiplantibacillus carotarum]
MATEKKVKREIYDEKDKRLGRGIMVVAKWFAIIGGVVGPFVYLLNQTWGINIGTLAVLVGGSYICFSPTGRTAGGQWLALLESLGVGVLVLGYYLLVLKFIHF